MPNIDGGLGSPPAVTRFVGCERRFVTACSRAPGGGGGEPSLSRRRLQHRTGEVKRAPGSAGTDQEASGRESLEFRAGD